MSAGTLLTGGFTARGALAGPLLPPLLPPPAAAATTARPSTPPPMASGLSPAAAVPAPASAATPPAAAASAVTAPSALAIWAGAAFSATAWASALATSAALSAWGWAALRAASLSSASMSCAWALAARDAAAWGCDGCLVMLFWVAMSVCLTKGMTASCPCRGVLSLAWSSAGVGDLSGACHGFRRRVPVCRMSVPGTGSHRGSFRHTL